MADKTSDLVDRGNKASTPSGTLAFVGLRALDPFLQYSLLSSGAAFTLLARFPIALIHPGAPSSTLGPLDALHLSPYRAALLSMTVAAAAKHAIWKLFIGEEAMTVGAAAIISAFNTVFMLANTVSFLAARTSPAAALGGEGPGAPGGFPGVPLALGGALCALGLSVELVAEWQRKVFKQDPANKGKAFTGGLFGLARHINYGAYTLWRGGVGLASGGWVLGAATAGFFAYDFSTRAVPVLDKYCSERYAEQWAEYRQKTRWILLPYIY